MKFMSVLLIFLAILLIASLAMQAVGQEPAVSPSTPAIAISKEDHLEGLKMWAQMQELQRRFTFHVAGLRQKYQCPDCLLDLAEGVLIKPEAVE